MWNLLGTNAKNDLLKVRNLHASHQIITENCFGITVEEKSLEYLHEKKIAGDGYLWNPEKRDVDKEEDHIRTEKTSMIVRSKSLFERSDGLRIIDQDVAKTEDFTELRGTSMIADELDTTPDRRQALLSNFSSDSTQLLLS
jgi:hypothetical protein